MYTGNFVFSQLMAHLPMHTFRRCVERYHGNRYVKSFTCLDQFLCLAFAQLTHRESLRDIEVCLRAHQDKLYHLGLRGGVARNTLAHALIRIARPLYAEDNLGLELDNTVYALDSSTIDLCLAVFPWAHFRQTKAAVKLHTLLDLQGSIPTFIHVSDGKRHDVKVLDLLIPEPGAIYVMDRAYLDFQRLFALTLAAAFFVIRNKSNICYRRRYSHQVNRATGLICDQTIVLTGKHTPAYYPQPLRCIKYRDPHTQTTFEFLTNHFTLPALTITELYRYRWRVELFFKWIKQHLRLKAFFGTSENAVKTQLWTAISVYVLVAIVKKRLKLPTELYTILQILSLTLFEKVPLYQLLTQTDYKDDRRDILNQLNLFD